MTRNISSDGECYGLDTSVDEAISYYSALQILQQRIDGLTQEEFSTWVLLGYLHAFESVNGGGGEADILATKVLAVSQPFANADYRSKPLDLLLHYKFSRNEVESFDPESIGSEWNPSGRFWTHEQVVQYLMTYSDKEYAEKLIDRELRSGALRPIHPVLGVHTPGAEIESLDYANIGVEEVLAYLMFPVAWISQLRAEEFKDVEPCEHLESSKGSLKPTTVKASNWPNPFRDVAGLRWEEIVIQFVTPEAVRIRARGIKERFTYAEMGFKDGKSRQASPDAIWRSLYTIFAPHRGEVSWRTENVDEKDRNRIKRTVSTIRKRLKEFFGINDDPFHPYREVKSYKMKLVLLPDQNSADIYKARFDQSSGDENDDDDIESLMSEPPFS